MFCANMSVQENDLARIDEISNNLGNTDINRSNAASILRKGNELESSAKQSTVKLQAEERGNNRNLMFYLDEGNFVMN